MGVQRGFYSAHGRQLSWVTIAFQIFNLQSANAMLGADRAVHFMHKIMQVRFDARA